MWILGQTPWIDADLTFTIGTPPLIRYDTDTGVGMTWHAGHPRSSPATAVVVGLNREDVSGQSAVQAGYLSASGECPCNNYHPVKLV